MRSHRYSLHYTSKHTIGLALASVVHLIEALSSTPKGGGFDSQSGHVQEASNQCFSPTTMVSLSLSLFLSFSPHLLNKNMASGEDYKK